MARTIPEIKKVMTDEWMSHPEVIEKYNLDTSKTFEQQFSKACLESIRFYVIAFAHWFMEVLFDKQLEIMDDKIRNQRVHTIGWYRTASLNFQFGGVFKDDITEYDNAGLTDEDIEKQRIIKKCSVTKADTDKPTLIVKVLKTDGKLTVPEMESFKAYMDAITDAGINIEPISENADRLVLYITIRYDGMVMDNVGIRFMDGKKPAEDGVVEHLNNLQFNGIFYPSHLEQFLMKQSGIKVATVRLAMASIQGQPPKEIVDMYAPYSGAISVDITNDLHIDYERF